MCMFILHVYLLTSTQFSNSNPSIVAVVSKRIWWQNGARRFCVGFRKLNIITQPDGYQLPRIDDILDRLASSRVYTTLDLKSGYWQVKLSKNSIPKTAFSTPDGHFEF